MASLKDVAKLAGVSPSTVSKVLSGRYKLSPQCTSRVMDAVRQLDYQPNIIGRSLRSSQSQAVLLVCSVFVREIMTGVHHAARELGYDVISMLVDPGEDESYLKYLENGLAGGVIFINYRHNPEKLARVAGRYPLVQCSEFVEMANSSQVSVDNNQAVYELTSALIARGRRRFAFVNSAEVRGHVPFFAQEREKGFRRALEQHKMPYYPQLTLRTEAGHDYRDFVALADTFIKLPPGKRPDAVVCISDLVGAAFVNAFVQAGISVPDKMAVTGFDNTLFSTVCTPQLTTVEQPFFEMGAEAMRLLAGSIAGEQTVNRKILLQHTLVARGSTPPLM